MHLLQTGNCFNCSGELQKRTPKNAVDAVAWKLTVLEIKKLHVRYYIFRSHVIELSTTTSNSEPFFPPFVPETDRRRRPPPPPTTPEDTTNNEELTRQPTTAEVNEITDVATESEKLTTEESTSEGVTDQVNEITDVATEKLTIEESTSEGVTDQVNEITDVATEKLTTEESTSEGVTDQIREMVTELDGGVTVEPIVILLESDESDTDYEEFIPGEIPDYSGSDNYHDFLPDENKR